ncbi:MAG TPA: response regulator [Candidatus Angelobacter sp.]|nr:response regulator [Candidatus Angelobacter sp.]
MALRILFADDSMTAQNMGKKILSEAGYDVVAVSNGAAAVKKIAEQKPDIIILDVYMPGYSGLEVCEKVRASLDTVKTPVLLTVGKMEPYKPEDANRVKADGVIIKPFEATDLLAIVKKFEERIAAMPPPPIVAQTVRIEPKYVEEPEGPEHVDHHTSSGKSHTQPMVEVPDHMASSSAFSDLLGTDAPNTTQHFAVNTPSTAFETSVIVPVPPVASSEDETPASWKEDQAEHITTVAMEAEPDIVATRVSDDQEAVQEAPVASKGFGGIELPEPETQAIDAQPKAAEPDTQVIPVEAIEPPRHPQFIPVYKEPEPDPAAYEMMPTAAAPTGEIEIPRDPELQESAEETTRNTVADHVDPGLLSAREQLETPIVPEPEPPIAEAQVEAAPFEVAPIEVAPTEMEVTPVEVAPADIAPQAVTSHEVKPMEVVPVESDFAPAPPIELPTVEAPIIQAAPVAEATPVTEAPPVAAAETVSDSDFEARVAAAMAAYNYAEAAPSSAAPVAVTESPVTAVIEAAPANNAYKAQAFEIAQPAEPAPSFEYHPAAKVPEPEPVAHTPAPAELAPEPVPASPAFVAPPSVATPVPVEAAPSLIHNAIASVEAAAVAAVTDIGSDHHNIAQAIHRVMERLKPELVEEIMRELKPKK